MSKWFRMFSGDNKTDDASALGQRRRQAERYPYYTQLLVRCASWPEFDRLSTVDISASGILLACETPCVPGENATIIYTDRDSHDYPLTGKVARIANNPDGSLRGFAVHLSQELDASVHRKLQEFVATARSGQPELPPPPALEPPRPSVPPVPTADTPALASPSTSGSIPILEDDIASELDGDADKSAPPIPPPLGMPAVAPPLPGGPPPLPPVPNQATTKAPPPTKPPTPTKPIPPRDNSPVIGIDLGTSYTAVAAIVGKQVKVLAWPDGSQSLASVLWFAEKNKPPIIGARAKEKIATDPRHTVSSPKRLLGRQFSEKEIQPFLTQAAYRTLPGPDGSVLVEMHDEQYAVTQLISYLLDAARSLAVTELRTDIRRCVLTVPVSFDEERTKILARAASLAQLEPIGFIDEPSSAALANRFTPDFGGTVGVFDFGGGTLDFSIVDVSKGDFMVLGTAGDTWLGGDDFDEAIANAAADQFHRQNDVDLRHRQVEWQRLLFACEQAKRALSTSYNAQIHVPDAITSAHGNVDLQLAIDRELFRKATARVVERSLATCQQALDLLDMKPTELTAIYLSGGSTYVPVVRSSLAERFCVPIKTGVPPEYAVCLGAAIHAAQIQHTGKTTLEDHIA